VKELGLFGALVPRDYGGLGLDVTAYAQVIVESKQGDGGGVTVETLATNQRGDTVCSYIRKVLVPKRIHAMLGEGKLPY